MPYPRRITKKRQKEVLDLWIKGYTIDEIAEKADFHPQTIFNDIKKIKKDFVETVDNEPKIKSYLSKIIKNNEKVLTELWKIYDEEKTLASKRSTMRVMIEQLVNFYNTLSKLGILKEAPKKVDIRSVELQMTQENFSDLMIRYNKAIEKFQ